jgi:acyl-CoA reductase-like NAD-dependent aldehyde dehydrogenase
MGDLPCLNPWINGGTHRAEAVSSSPLVSPVDMTVVARVIDSDAAVIDCAVESAYAAFLAQQEVTVAQRIDWLVAAADTAA